jgi:hypothetical protein
MLADRVSVLGNRIRIEGRSATDNGARVFEGEAVFVAAGLLESARIVLNSTRRASVSLQVRQSDIFTFPMLRYRSTGTIAQERIHTLCQMVMDISDSGISPNPIQLQLYGYNDLYPELLARRLGPLAFPLKPLLRHISERLFVAFGYLHSDVSSRVWITRSDDSDGRLHLRGELEYKTQSAGQAVVRKLFRLQKYLRAVPVPLQLRFDNPGGGHRSGGCFPMRHAPVGLQTDSLGRIAGLPGVHIVDSSILPSVPARPVAFTVMANAYRIASQSPLGNVA